MTERVGQPERGSVSIFVVIMAVPMVLMAALAFDGGRILDTRRHALDVAQNAALAGSQALNATTARQGAVAVDPGLIQAAVEDYLTTSHSLGPSATWTSAVEVTAASPTRTVTEVRVTVTEVVETELLALVGIKSKTVTGTGRTLLVRGVTGPDA
jgi:Flp pilus assembly protein TadG